MGQVAAPVRPTALTIAPHPAVAFGSVLVRAALLGPLGGLLALPVTASRQVFVSSYLHRYELVDDPLLG